MKKQILAGILSATMVVGMGGVSVFAADKADDKNIQHRYLPSSYSTKHWTLQHRDSKMRSQKTWR